MTRNKTISYIYIYIRLSYMTRNKTISWHKKSSYMYFLPKEIKLYAFVAARNWVIRRTPSYPLSYTPQQPHPPFQITGRITSMKSCFSADGSGDTNRTSALGLTVYGSKWGTHEGEQVPGLSLTCPGTFLWLGVVGLSRTCPECREASPATFLWLTQFLGQVHNKV